jgi:hypothetical protein
MLPDDDVLSTLGDVQRPRVIRVGILPSWKPGSPIFSVQIRASAPGLNRHLITGPVVVHQGVSISSARAVMGRHRVSTRSPRNP